MEILLLPGGAFRFSRPPARGYSTSIPAKTMPAMLEPISVSTGLVIEVSGPGLIAARTCATTFTGLLQSMDLAYFPDVPSAAGAGVVSSVNA
ncbi:MAG: hypothetical protein ACK4RN_08020 [Pseudorhodobacter sp.]